LELVNLGKLKLLIDNNVNDFFVCNKPGLTAICVFYWGLSCC